MTEKQLKVLEYLLIGGNVAPVRPGVYRVRDRQHNPVMTFTSRCWYHVHKFCRRQGLLYVVDKRIIRKLPNHHRAKKFYDQLIKHERAERRKKELTHRISMA